MQKVFSLRSGYNAVACDKDRHVLSLEIGVGIRGMKLFNDRYTRQGVRVLEINGLLAALNGWLLWFAARDCLHEPSLPYWRPFCAMVGGITALVIGPLIAVICEWRVHRPFKVLERSALLTALFPAEIVLFFWSGLFLCEFTDLAMRVLIPVNFLLILWLGGMRQHEMSVRT